eukprot:1596065-Amphidinium_carterae.1
MGSSTLFHKTKLCKFHAIGACTKGTVVALHACVHSPWLVWATQVHERGVGCDVRLCVHLCPWLVRDAAPARFPLHQDLSVHDESWNL